jgi:hypothetical protein
MEGLRLYARDQGVNGLRRKSEDGESGWMQKDGDGSNRRNSCNDVATNIKESNS